MWLTSAWDWIEDRASDAVHAGSSVLSSAEHLIEGGATEVESFVSAAHVDAQGLVRWVGHEADKSQDLMAHVLDKGEAFAEHAVDSVGGVATDLIDKSASTISMPLLLLGGGALLFMMGAGKNSSFSYAGR